jgi:hypothetical protein
MSVWTPQELDEQIAATKAALKEAVQMQSYEQGTGGSNVKVARNQVKDLTNYLNYLESERARLNGEQGFMVHAGRPCR